MEIILYALTSMLFSVITVIVIFLGIYLLTQGSQEEQRWKKEQEKLLWELERYNMSQNQTGNAASDQTEGKIQSENQVTEKKEDTHRLYYEEPKLLIRGWLVGAILLTLFLFIIYFLLLTEKFSRYLNEITDGIQEISAGNFDVEFSVRHEDELSMIAEGLNKMLGDIRFMMENERNQEYSKNELITNVAHDLRTPLTSIIGYLGLVTGRQDLDAETKKHYVEIAYDKSKRLEGLIESLFSFTKVSFGQITLHKSTVDLVKLTEQLLEEFYPTIEEAGLETEFLSSEKQILREVDGDLMARAVANLISNAIKYGRDGKLLKVEVKRTTIASKLMVTNFGRMIPEADLEHIFDKFYRVESSRSTDTGGTGLGLAITRNIVRMHNGTVHAKSDPAGTVFTVTLYDHPEDNPEAQGDEDDEKEK
ncbi:MAG: HAMP domain-containing sensor histidine kinase [Lachnospiraceae bacterium]|nr:HAMP domain-containing sensor histidine kinase [Lachnospiraceae bacterium]